MNLPDYTNKAPHWQVFSYSYDGNESQLIIPDNEEEAYRVYAIVKSVYNKGCIHLLIESGFVIRQVTSVI